VDGSRRVDTFQSTDTFKNALEKFGMVGHIFRTAFPPKVKYSSEDNHKTLEELGASRD